MREDDLADVLYEQAQERYSRRIARKIADARRVSPINTTDRLAEPGAIGDPEAGRSPGEDRPRHPHVPRARIAVNRETENLAALLERAPRALRPPASDASAAGAWPSSVSSRPKTEW
jgi:16S rRNA (cytosine1402-N4)-methyltransferase